MRQRDAVLIHDRVLVIDDDPDMRDGLREVLRATGYAVETATSGREGLERARLSPTDAAIVDVRLPDISGVDLLKLIKASSPTTEVIVLTGYGSLPTAIEALNGAAFAYLQKPVEIDHLLATVARAVERKRAEEARQQREQEFSDFFENAPLGLHWLGPDGRIQWANQAELDLLGYPREEYVGRHVGAFHADRSVVDDMLARLGRNETLRNFEARLRAKDGSIRHVLINSNVLWEAGKVVRTRCFMRDMTERKRTEEIALALAHVGRELAANLDVGQATDRVVSTVRRLFGVRRSALFELDPGRGTSTCVAAAGDGDSEQWVGQVLAAGGAPGRAGAGGQPVWTADLLADQGMPPWLTERLAAEGLQSAAGAPLRSHGETLGFLALLDAPGRVFTQDELKLLFAFADQAGLALRNARLYAEVRATRDFLQSIAENSADAIVTTDVCGRFTYVSPGAEEMFGYRAEEALGRPAAAYYSGGQPEARAIARRLVAEGRIRNYETGLRARDGRLVPISASISLLRNATGAITGTVGVIKDMTEREVAEGARREAAELRAVTLLAAGAAHEINNPLAVVFGRLEMLAWRLPADSVETKGIRQALTAAEDIRNIVARMGRITRIATAPIDHRLPDFLDIEKSSDPG